MFSIILLCSIDASFVSSSFVTQIIDLDYIGDASPNEFIKHVKFRSRVDDWGYAQHFSFALFHHSFEEGSAYADDFVATLRATLLQDYEKPIIGKAVLWS
jgi:hypothetical protein